MGYRRAVIGLYVANVLHGQYGIDVPYLGLYDPVDRSKIPDHSTRHVATGGAVAGVASQEGSKNKDYLDEMPRLLDLTAEQDVYEDEITGVNKLLLDATLGALGGIPGYNDDPKIKERGEDPGPDYNYLIVLCVIIA